ncbi:DUF1176 domain-containing protein [Kumtagia ephedrae]|uniref:DUF1176 domain-containing protein n=1 Tax=Kumtagia ephedrae TaxID=2116701 RepID=UPI00315AFD3E
MRRRACAGAARRRARAGAKSFRGAACVGMLGDPAGRQHRRAGELHDSVPLHVGRRGRSGKHGAPVPLLLRRRRLQREPRLLPAHRGRGPARVALRHAGTRHPLRERRFRWQGREHDDHRLRTDDALVNSFYDDASKSITSAAKWRGVGDASSSGTWMFRDGTFTLVRYDVDASYDGEINPETVLDFHTGP